MSGAVFIFGPSCSGKSTLAKALQNNLGSDWSYLDRDELIEQNHCNDSTADQTLDEKIEAIREKIIVDAQVPWRDRRENEFYFLVLPSLEVLLQRDSERTIRLHRSPSRAQHAREYVLETYDILSKMDKSKFDFSFDSSYFFIPDEISLIKTIMTSAMSALKI